jgi:hypothetical protein
VHGVLNDEYFKTKASILKEIPDDDGIKGIEQIKLSKSSYMSNVCFPDAHQIEFCGIFEEYI